MVAAVTVDAAQAFTIAATTADTTILVAQAHILAAAAHPAPLLSASQALVNVAVEADTTILATQAFLMVAAIGRTNDPTIRVWTFTLDGHDFVVLRLGTTETLVYDYSTEQWSVWGSDDSGLWRAYNGCNWIGAESIAGGYGSTVVVGDDGNGALYFLDPDNALDDDALQGSDAPHSFTREAVGQLFTHGYNKMRVFGVSLLGGIGEGTDDTYTTVNLSYSDDVGHTYTDAGDITIVPTDYSARANWRSLGAVSYPGRLLKISDTGALKRIDSLDVNDGSS